MAAPSMRWIFSASALFLTAATVLGLVINGGKKYVRIRPEDGCVASFANVYNSTAAGLVCCTGGKDDHGVCPGPRFSSATRLLTSYWAFVIPLAGFFMNVLCQHLSGVSVTSRIRQSQARRLLLYVGLVLGRSFGLYMAMNVVQDKILQPRESSMCWYASLRRSGTCSERFDFADHVVLAVCQYLAIQVLEIYCVTMEYRELLADGTSSSTTTVTDVACGGTPVPSPALAIPLGVCVLVSACSLVLVFETSAFFHTRSETLAALVISWVFVGQHLKRLAVYAWS